MFVLLLTNCSFLVFLKTMFFQSQIRYYLHFLRMKVELSTFTFVELKMKFKKKKKILIRNIQQGFAMEFNDLNLFPCQELCI